MANELRAASGLNFGAFQAAHSKPGAWLKPASVPTLQGFGGRKTPNKVSIHAGWRGFAGATTCGRWHQQSGRRLMQYPMAVKADDQSLGEGTGPNSRTPHTPIDTPAPVVVLDQNDWPICSGNGGGFDQTTHLNPKTKSRGNFSPTNRLQISRGCRASALPRLRMRFRAPI
jgi:hypothetical protein